MEQGHQKEPTISQQVEELKVKVEKTRQAAEEIKAREEEKKGMLIKEIADMVEGNEKLGRIVQQDREYARGYKDIDQKQMDTIEELKREIRYAEETIGSLGQDDVPQEDIQRLRESMSRQKDDISGLENRLKEAADLHNKFMDEQKEANGDTLEFAVDAFMQGGLAPEMDEESKNALKAGVLNEIKRRQEEEEKERARESVERDIEKYDAVIGAVAKDFEELKDNTDKELEAFEKELRDPKLLKDTVRRKEEREKKERKLYRRFPMFESTKDKLLREIKEEDSHFRKTNQEIKNKIYNIAEGVRGFLIQQRKAYDSSKISLGNLASGVYTYNLSKSELESSGLEFKIEELAKRKVQLLNEIEVYYQGLSKKYGEHVIRIDKIIPLKKR